MSPSTITCPVHGTEPGQPCSLLVPICEDRIAASCNPLVELFRAMSTPALEAGRAEAKHRTSAIDPGVSLPPVVREDEPC